MAVEPLSRSTEQPASAESIRLAEALESQRHRRHRKRQISAVSTPSIFMGAVLVTWEVVVRWLDVPAYLVPAPTVIGAELVDKFDIITRNAMTTGKEIVIGYAIAIFAAMLLAVAIAHSKLAERLIYPVIVSIKATPKSALAPLFIIWFGFGMTPKILMVILISFFPIVIDAVVGLVSLDEKKKDLARITGLSPWRTFVRIEVPNALPSMFGGLKVGMMLAITGAIVAEFVGADAGLGYLLIVATTTLNTSLLFAVLLVLTFFGVGLFVMISMLENLAIPWHVSKRDR